VLTTFVAELAEDIFTCVDFDCASASTLAACATLDETTQKFAVPLKERACSLAELVSTFDDAGANLRTAITDVQEAGTTFMPDIATKLKDLIYAKMVDPFLAIIDKDKMNCGFLVTAWAGFLEGTCYKLGGAMASYANIFTLCAQCGFVLVLLIFGVWRHFIDMYDAVQKEAKVVKAEEETE
jgi:hypothetical protein